jgi:hypothetical protein
MKNAATSCLPNGTFANACASTVPGTLVASNEIDFLPNFQASVVDKIGNGSKVATQKIIIQK